jgi:hypothetical protein
VLQCLDRCHADSCRICAGGRRATELIWVWALEKVAVVCLLVH